MIVLGEGVLNWFRDERQTDRYGTVYLGDSRGGGGIMSPATTGCVQLDRSAEGKKGALFAVVVDNSEPSQHIGDLARGIGPTHPDIGERIKFGEGVLFFEIEEEQGITFCKVGVKLRCQ